MLGITNHNEFYTSNYLAAILQDDLKDLARGWKQREADEADFRGPDKRLGGMSADYFRARERWARSQSATERTAIQEGFLRSFLDCLGYQWQPQQVWLDDGSQLPLVCERRKTGGQPELWLIQTLSQPEHAPTGDELAVHDPLADALCAAQFADAEFADSLQGPLEDILSRAVFAQAEPPRWVLLFNFTTIALLDRSKWNEKRFLSFDLAEILSRREPDPLRAMAALLHCDSICNPQGACLLDNLSDKSHKHAFAVSEDLKYAAREAVELLGNEAIWYLRYRRKERLFTRDDIDDLADELTVECLRYLYRLLFLFYIEARPELGYAPMKSDEYVSGYSLESLRDLEMVELHDEAEQNGDFIHQSLQVLTQLIFDGFSPDQHVELDFDSDAAGIDHHIFAMRPLRSHLFDPRHTPWLNKVRFRNHVLVRVLNLLSLSSEKSAKKKGKRGRRGRISYAQLGINQLGAVYEGLLSYSGFFAKTDLYEVKPAKDTYDPLKNAHFVPEPELHHYSEAERVYHDADTVIVHGNGEAIHYREGELVCHRAGDFIYRLAGRNRQKSASYYTPEVLTQCVVKYALKELLAAEPPGEVASGEGLVASDLKKVTRDQELVASDSKKVTAPPNN